MNAQSLSLAGIARALGGKVHGDHVLAPGPGHSSGDRSLSVTLAGPDGITVHSFAGDDWRSCKDHVRYKLGLGRFVRARPIAERGPRLAPVREDLDRVALASRIWREATDPRGTPVEHYLAGRSLALEGDVAGAVIRFHPRAAFRDGSGELIRMPAMIAVMRNIVTDEITAVQRTFLRPDAAKFDRRMLGVAAAAAIKLDPDENVLGGLIIGEGCETVLAARGLGYRSAWALGSVGAIASFPVLSGIEALTILEETGEASWRAVQECGGRWHAAGREVRTVRPRAGSDVNDAVRELGQ